MDNVGGFGGVADRLNAYNTYCGDPGRFATDFTRFQEVAADTIRDVARRHLHRKPSVRLTVLGKRPVASGPPLDRSVTPASTPAVAFRAPVPQVVNLNCGIPLWVIPRRDLPIIAMTISVAGGAGVQEPSAAGLAQLTTTMMDEGTTTRSSIELARATEAMGTTLSTHCGWDGAYVGVQCLTPHWLSSLELAADVLRNPTFPESEWGRIRGQTLAALKAERDSAEVLASRGLLAALYGTDHPYRLPIDGEFTIVGRHTREDLARFHERFHGPSRAACVVAGDVDIDEVATALNAALAGWTGPDVRPARLPEPELSPRPRILLLDRPGAPNAVVRVGHIGIARLDPDFTDALVFNQILGGQFTSRLNSKLREEKGMTYGVRSHFDTRRGAGPFYVGASLQSDRLGEALADLRGEIEALIGDRPPTEAELDDARRALVEGQARQFETPSALVSRYAGLLVHDLPADHHSTFADRLAGVTVASMTAVAAAKVHPNSLVAVVVADASQVRGQLERLGWSDVEIVADV
jgi:zinc protease